LARLVTHYRRHAAFLEDGSLLRDAPTTLANIPGVLIHGRRDVSSPFDIPWRLSRAWPGSRLAVIDDAGHSGTDSGMGAAIVAATDSFRS
jgi:proline iminopeptidase